MIPYTMIYDRTEADVDEARRLLRKGYINLTQAEKQKWDNGLKGCFNASDLNRILGAIKAVADEIGVEMSAVKTFADGDIPREADFSDMLQRLASISGLYIYPSTPAIPSAPINTYDKINAVEKIIHDVDDVYVKVMANVTRAGELYAGEEYSL